MADRSSRKATNRNSQRISNVMLMMLVAGLGRDAKSRGDEQGKNYAKQDCVLLLSHKGY